MPPAAVTDLTGAVAGDVLELTWGIPAVGDDAGEADGFAVYRAKTPVEEAECRDCPLIFHRIAQVSITPSLRQNGRMTFSDPLENGYRYHYKLRSYDVFGAAGDDSNTFAVDY